jgi:hypothetical protein
MNIKKPNKHNCSNNTINTKSEVATIRIDFSFKREVFFVVVGAILGAVHQIF